MDLWTKDDINRILLQLEERFVSEKGFRFVKENGSPKLLGRGGSGYVYEVLSEKDNTEYALKVIGFFGKYIDEENSILTYDFSDHIVKQYDYGDLWVLLDEDDNVSEVINERPEDRKERCLRLQFILMEKLSPVIKRTKAGNIEVNPLGLAKGKEEWILKLAADIGEALQELHKNGILHRDIKLENVFYDGKEDRYVLGDFGVAKKTKDGFADTIAFTKGYAAPEVIGKNDEKYDNTADIYSYGMMLFVLSNHIRFPESETYNINYGIQYCKGYVLPKPSGDISNGLYMIIRKACMYDPDDRYQSMKDILIDLKELYYKDGMEYYAEGHKKADILVAAVLCIFGLFVWNTDLKSRGNEWIAVTLFSLSFVFTLEYLELSNPNSRGNETFWKNWIMCIAFYCLCVLLGIKVKAHGLDGYVMHSFLIGDFYNFIWSLEIHKVGIAGIVIILLWLLRLFLLQRRSKISDRD